MNIGYPVPGILLSLGPNILGTQEELHHLTQKVYEPIVVMLEVVPIVTLEEKDQVEEVFPVKVPHAIIWVKEVMQHHLTGVSKIHLDHQVEEIKVPKPS